MALQTLTLGYGKANLKNTLATYATLKVEPPFIRVAAVGAGKRKGQTAINVGTHEVYGVLLTAQVEHENGSVICLQCQWKRNGAPIRDGALFLRLRAGAPLYNINASVPMAPEAICGNSFLIFSGYADILNAGDLQLLGIKANDQWVNRFTDEEELAECFSISKIMSETAGRPVITAISTPTGVELRETASMPQRRLIMRKKE